MSLGLPKERTLRTQSCPAVNHGTADHYCSSSGANKIPDFLKSRDLVLMETPIGRFQQYDRQRIQHQEIQTNDSACSKSWGKKGMGRILARFDYLLNLES